MSHYGKKVCKVIIIDDSIVDIISSDTYKANKIIIENIEMLYDSYLFNDENKCKLAVFQNGLSIQYIKDENQTNEICRIAVKQNGLSLQYINDEKQTNEICRLAVSQNGCVIQYIKDEKITDEICRIAVKQNGLSLQLSLIHI